MWGRGSAFGRVRGGVAVGTAGVQGGAGAGVATVGGIDVMDKREGRGRIGAARIAPAPVRR